MHCLYIIISTALIVIHIVYNYHRAEQLHQAQSKGRVRTANLMIVIIIIGCFIAVASGKRDAKAGKSLSRDNQEWHAQINKDFKDSKEVALKSK